MKKFFTFILLFVVTLLKAQTTCNWAYVPVGPSASYHTIYISTVDHSGNIIQVGKNLGNADMDPSPDPNDTSFCYGGFNYYVSSTSNTGKLNWIHYFEDNSLFALFEFKGLQVNSQNEIIILGNYYGLIDFDFSPTGVDTLRSHAPTYPDYFVAKYDSLGNYDWAISIGDSARTISSCAMNVMDNDRILIVANPNGPVDVDPSPNIHNTLGGNANIICYDTDGKYVWNKNIGVTYSYGVVAKSIASDINFNSYLLNVGYYELTVSKFNSTGSLIWDKTIGDFATGARVDPQSVLVSKANGSFYVAGTFQGTVDFDPGSATVNKTSSSGFYQDGFIAKYDSAMNLIWVNQYAGKVSFGKYTLEYYGPNLILSGSFEGLIDFGNGNIFTGGASGNPFYLRIDTLGNTINMLTLSGLGAFNTLNTSINNTFVTTGYIAAGTNMNPYGPAKIINSPNNNFFTAVYQNTVSTGIATNTEESLISIFPNPTRDLVYFTFDKTCIGKYYTIFDVTGKCIYHSLIKQSTFSINSSQFANGYYTIKVDNSTTKEAKFIKL